MSLKKSKALAYALAVCALNLTVTQARAENEIGRLSFSDEDSTQACAPAIRNRTAERCENLTQASIHLDSMKSTLDRADGWLKAEHPNLRGACTYIGAAKSFADLIRLIPSNDSLGLIDSQLTQSRINALLSYADDLATYCVDTTVEIETIKSGVHGILTSEALIFHRGGRIEGAPMMLKHSITQLKNQLNCQRFGQ